MKGCYHLFTDESGTYSTNSYELFILYLKLFDYSKYKQVMYKKQWKKPSSYVESVEFESDHHTFLKALAQEKRVFECGYIPVLTSYVNKFGKKCLRTQWEYSPEKARSFLKNSKVVKKIDGVSYEKNSGC